MPELPLRVQQNTSTGFTFRVSGQSSTSSSSSTGPSIRGTSSAEHCRICLLKEHCSGRNHEDLYPYVQDDYTFVKPCKCRGSWINVHRRCLNKRRTEGVAYGNLFQCEVCKHRYEFDTPNASYHIHSYLTGTLLLGAAVFVCTAFILGGCMKASEILEHSFEAWTGNDFFALREVWQWWLVGCLMNFMILAPVYWFGLAKGRARAIAIDLLNPEIGSWVEKADAKRCSSNSACWHLEANGPWSKPEVTNPLHALLLLAWVLFLAPLLTLWALHEDARAYVATRYVVRSYAHPKREVELGTSSFSSNGSSKASSSSQGSRKTDCTLGRHATNRSPQNVTLELSNGLPDPNPSMPRLLGKIGSKGPDWDKKLREAEKTPEGSPKAEV